jgi:succinoglycan biosynthesis protein ExoA
MSDDGQPFVAITVPTLNEEWYIEGTLHSLLGQWPEDRCEILVVDGGSTDRTTAIVRAMRAAHPNLRLLHNPRRIQSAAVNLAARLADARAGISIRADAHALYPPSFIEICVAALRRSGAASVVVPMRTVGHARQQRAIAAVQNSRLGNGGSAHRRGDASGFVDHGHHAAFDRTVFLDVGGYDEEFTHNEDAEFDQRLNQAGHRVWMEATATITYFPRNGLKALARQYFRHGQGRARTLLLHNQHPRPRQMAPLLILAGVVYGLALTPLTPLAALVPAAYLALCLGWGVVASLRARDPWLLAMGPAAVVMHLSWAAGFLRECVAPRLPRGGRENPAAPQRTAEMEASSPEARMAAPGAERLATDEAGRGSGERLAEAAETEPTQRRAG